MLFVAQFHPVLINLAQGIAITIGIVGLLICE